MPPIDWSSKISAAEERIKAWAAQRIANLVQLAPLSSSDTKRGGFRVEGRPNTQRGYSQSARLMQHSGFQSRAPNQTNVVKLSVEGGGAKAVIVAEDDGIDLELAAGSAALYSPGKPDGKVIATPAGGLELKTAGAENAVVQEGDKLVATDTTPTDNGVIAMTAVTAGAPPVTTVTFTFTPPGGAPSVLGVLLFTSGVLTGSTPGSVALTGKVDGGSPHFLAPGPTP
jgi:hypothetical protein